MKSTTGTKSSKISTQEAAQTDEHVCTLLWEAAALKFAARHFISPFVLRSSDSEIENYGTQTSAGRLVSHLPS